MDKFKWLASKVTALTSGSRTVEPVSPLDVPAVATVPEEQPPELFSAKDIKLDAYISDLRKDNEKLENEIKSLSKRLRFEKSTHEEELKVCSLSRTSNILGFGNKQKVKNKVTQSPRKIGPTK